MSTTNKWFSRVTLTESQTEALALQSLIGALVQYLKSDDAFVVFEVGSVTEKPHLHLIFSCKGSKETVAKAIKKVFSLASNSGMYSLKEFEEGGLAYEYCCKGEDPDTKPNVVYDAVGRMVDQMHAKFWADRAAFQQTKGAAKRSVAKSNVDFKDEFLRRCKEQKFVEKASIARFAVQLSVELSRPINLFHLESLCRLAYASCDDFAVQDVTDQLLERLNK